jgi:hypothetical protein
VAALAAVEAQGPLHALLLAAAHTGTLDAALGGTQRASCSSWGCLRTAAGGKAPDQGPLPLASLQPPAVAAGTCVA